VESLDQIPEADSSHPLVRQTVVEFGVAIEGVVVKEELPESRSLPPVLLRVSGQCGFVKNPGCYLAASA
jgi:hypothetical protein